MQPAKSDPVLENFWIDEEFLQETFVIAAETNGTTANHSDSELVNDAFRIGAAVDVVAEIDFNSALDRSPSNVRLDPIDDVDKKIRTAMDIADGIYPDAGWQGAEGRRTHLQVPRVEK